MLAPIKNKNALKEAVICHKIALSYLLLDELNPEVADSNPFKKQCDAMADKCNEIVSDVFEYKK
jgi:hypothetical protein